MFSTRQTFFSSETRDTDENIFDGENRVDQVRIKADDILVKMDSEEDARLVIDTLNLKNMLDENTIPIISVSNIEFKIPFNIDSIRMLHSCNFISYQTSSSMMSVYSHIELMKGIENRLLVNEFDTVSISDTKKP